MAKKKSMVDGVATPDVFAPAIEELRASNRDHTDPEPFQSYLARHGLPFRSTAQAISIQSLNQLARSLHDENVMVFRLGVNESGSQNANFALVRAARDIRDFFLLDLDGRESQETEFEPVVQAAELLPFHLLGELVESNSLGLAAASGLLERALALDPGWSRVMPVGVASTYTFRVRPRADMALTWNHTSGQVEVDALVLAQRHGRRTLFIVEAKNGLGTSLAKHKLVYAAMAVRQHGVPQDVDVVPVYVRSWQRPGYVHFRFLICGFEQRESSDPPAVDSLRVVERHFFRLPFQRPR